jgi:hypothetical protein
MSLRIRRGTDSQRQGITPLEGELLYATDTKKLYVGDGSTGGGIVVDSSAGTSTLNDLANVTAPSPNTNDIIKWNGSAWITAAQNAPASLNDLTNVSALPLTGESLIWSGTAWVAGRPEGDGSDLNVNIIGDDSSIIVNVATRSIVANYVTGNFVGDVFAEDGVSKIVSNGAVAGQATFTGDLEGNLLGSVYADNSTRIIDGQTGIITGNTFGVHTGDVVGDLTGDVVGDLTGNLVGNLTGNSTGLHTGDVQGSVFGDDSTLLLDGVAGKITGPIDTAINSFFEANLQLFKNVASDATRQQISVYSNQHGAFSQTAMNITNTGDTAVANELGLFKVRGTAQAFTATQASDSLGGISWSGYDGSAVQVGTSVKSEVVSISANNIAAKMCFYVRNGLIATYVKKAELSETGVFKVNAIESFTADTDLTIIANGTGAVKITDVKVFLPNLPTSDPSVAGQLWSNSGVVTISAG